MAETAYPTRRNRRAHEGESIERGRTADQDVDVVRTDEYAEDRDIAVTGGPRMVRSFTDRVRWGPIWAGLLSAVGTFMILTTGAIAVGAQTVDPQAAGNAATMSGIVSAVIALIAFFVGGFVAGWTAGVITPGASTLNGFLVWALGVGVILVLTAFGLGSIFGAAGEMFAQFQQLEAAQLQNVEASQVIEGIQTGAIGTFLALLISAAAAAAGGFLGGRAAPERVEA